MSKRQLLIVIGIWNMIFLFLSFPAAWDKIFALVSGVSIVMIASALKPTIKPVSDGAVPFVDHKAPRVDVSGQHITSTDSKMSS